MGNGRIADLDRLIAKLQDPDVVMRYRAVCRVGEMGHRAKRAIPALTKLLDDSDDGIVAEAADALGYIVRPGTAPEEVIGRLSELVSDPDAAVSAAAEWALSQIRPEAASAAPSVPPLVWVLGLTLIFLGIAALVSRLFGP